MINWNKPVRRKDGNWQSVRVICSDKKGVYPVVILCLANDGDEYVRSVTLDGREDRNGSIHWENVPEEEWALKYNKIPDGPYSMGSSIYSSFEELKDRLRNICDCYNSLIAIRLSDGKTEIIK